MRVEVRLEPRDLWVGVFWDYRPDPWGVRRLEVWVCPLPGLVIHAYFWPRRAT